MRRISGLGELRAGLEVLLGVQPDRDAGRDPAAAAGPLVGRGLADRLDRQPLHLGAHGVAARSARRRCRRRTGCPGRSARSRRRWWPAPRAAPSGARRPCAARRPRAASTAARPRARSSAGQRVGGVADLPLAGQEHQDVAGTLGRQLARPRRRSPRSGRGRSARPPRRPRAARRAGGSGSRPGRCGPTPRPRARRSAAANRSTSMVAEVMISLRSGRLGQQPLEVAEQEVDVEAALVGLVDDDRVVAAQLPVALQLGQQDAVGHHLDPAGPRGAVGEPHLVADQVARAGCRAPRRSARQRSGPRSAAAGCARSSRRPCRAGRGRAPGRSWAAAWSCPSRSRRPRSRPGGRGSPRRCRRGAG